ncbi:MAG TPA: hypothetical protein PK347_14455, partial [Burkholderiaceae bacterium]|nr:hypothetical protein [Burkholderiaceae bacterium]
MQELVEQIDDLEDFIYLKYDWQSTSPLVKAKSEHLHELLLTTMQRKSKRDMAFAFNVVMTALEVQGGYDRPIRIVTDPEVYGGVKTPRKPGPSWSREFQPT